MTILFLFFIGGVQNYFQLNIENNYELPVCHAVFKFQPY